MNREAFLRAPRPEYTGRNGGAPGDITVFSVTLANGRQRLIRASCQSVGSNWNKSTSVLSNGLDCNHNVENLTQVIVIGNCVFCTYCVRRCPECHEWVLPGCGVWIGEHLYHHEHAVTERAHIEHRKCLEEDAMLERVNGLRLQNSIAERRQTIEEQDREFQRRIALRGVDLQENRLFFDAVRAEAQYNLDKMSREADIDLRRRALDAQERTTIRAAESSRAFNPRGPRELP